MFTKMLSKYLKNNQFGLLLVWDHLAIFQNSEKKEIKKKTKLLAYLMFLGVLFPGKKPKKKTS